jgi:hypothetical protein
VQNENGEVVQDYGTDCRNCDRYKKLGDVCLIEHGKKFTWEYCRDFDPQVVLPDYKDLMKSVRLDQALERKKVKEKKEKEKRKKLKEKKEREELKRKKRRARQRKKRERLKKLSLKKKSEVLSVELVTPPKTSRRGRTSLNDSPLSGEQQGESTEIRDPPKSRSRRKPAKDSKDTLNGES